MSFIMHFNCWICIERSGKNFFRNFPQDIIDKKTLSSRKNIGKEDSILRIWDHNSKGRAVIIIFKMESIFQPRKLHFISISFSSKYLSWSDPLSHLNKTNDEREFSYISVRGLIIFFWCGWRDQEETKFYINLNWQFMN